ncbi:holo-[acyl-carrier-protein] synthase [Mycobacterium sp. E2497]|nr:holo-ACP synthase [Mycobacterium sp. E2497]OBI17471.1 holo-[acyl-carrier-protein] synthase [Mycobacterium sp. E2497]
MDLVEVARIEELMTSQPELRERVFTSRELAYCYRRRRVGEHLACRWAAKEAVLKSLGTGMGPRMEWTDIEVVNDRGGRPTVRLYGEVAVVARSLDMDYIDISLSHGGGLAVAQAVLVCLPCPSAPPPSGSRPSAGLRTQHQPAPDTAEEDDPAGQSDRAEGGDRYEA